jgi:CHC2 zinc finger
MNPSLDHLLDRLRGVRRCGEQWIAICPGHPDKNPSLSIREDTEKILLHCFAGCTVEAICAAVGIAVRDLFNLPRQSRKFLPFFVRDAGTQIASIRSRLTPRDREREITVVLASRENPDCAFARALALAVEGQLVQVAFRGEK